MDRVQRASWMIAGHHHARWSEALDPSVAYGFFVAVRAAADAFPETAELDFLQVGSHWGTSLGLVGALIHAVGRRPGRLVSVDPYSVGGTRPKVWAQMAEENAAVGADVRRRLKEMQSSGVSPQTVESLDGFSSLRMIAARATYKLLDLNVTHVKASSGVALQNLAAFAADAPRKFHLIHVDGLHSESTYIEDLYLTTKILRHGGILVQGGVFTSEAAPFNALVRAWPEAVLHSTWMTDILSLCDESDVNKSLASEHESCEQSVGASVDPARQVDVTGLPVKVSDEKASGLTIANQTAVETNDIVGVIGVPSVSGTSDDQVPKPTESGHSFVAPMDLPAMVGPRELGVAASELEAARNVSVPAASEHLGHDGKASLGEGSEVGLGGTVKDRVSQPTTSEQEFDSVDSRGSDGPQNLSVASHEKKASAWDDVKLFLKADKAPSYCAPRGGDLGGDHRFTDAVLFGNVSIPSPPFTFMAQFRAAEHGKIVSWSSGSSSLAGLQILVREDGTLEYSEFQDAWESLHAFGFPRVTANRDSGLVVDVAIARGLSGKTSLYVDDVLVGSGSLSPMDDLDVGVCGRRVHLHDMRLVGGVTDFRIWNAVLTQGELTLARSHVCNLMASRPTSCSGESGASGGGIMLFVGDFLHHDGTSSNEEERRQSCDDPIIDSQFLQAEFGHLRPVIVPFGAQKDGSANTFWNLSRVIFFERVKAALHADRGVTNGTGALEELARLEVPYVQIDLKSFDCDMVEFVLAQGVRPIVWRLRIDPSYPPPIQYNYAGQMGPATSPSCSLTYLSDILRPAGYALIRLDCHEVVYVTDDLASGFARGSLTDVEAYFNGWTEPWLQNRGGQCIWPLAEVAEAWQHAFFRSISRAQTAGESLVDGQWHPQGREALLLEAWKLASQLSAGEPFSVHLPMFPHELEL
eukprot:TRINITY_DN56023_c0_g1_i1.p1 TRINITY_DN56023_c0_g1~~TRINITY_DN56023_c0_g1_i1.p1  ORF type:complete len:1048 (-),score=163.35 TRINITY_DN56023_c0_g1_i1:71-2836(-)